MLRGLASTSRISPSCSPSRASPGSAASAARRKSWRRRSRPSAATSRGSKADPPKGCSSPAPVRPAAGRGRGTPARGDFRRARCDPGWHRRGAFRGRLRGPGGHRLPAGCVAVPDPAAPGRASGRARRGGGDIPVRDPAVRSGTLWTAGQGGDFSYFDDVPDCAYDLGKGRIGRARCILLGHSPTESRARCGIRQEMRGASDADFSTGVRPPPGR